MRISEVEIGLTLAVASEQRPRAFRRLAVVTVVVVAKDFDFTRVTLARVNATMLRDLLDAVVAAPDDDVPRRVYADALLEAGEPQGELIHVQCDLARGGLTREEGIVRRRRERELLDAHAARWTAGLAMTERTWFRRGFVDEVQIDVSKWVQQSAEVLAAAPALRLVSLRGLAATAHDPRDTAATVAWVLDTFRAALAVPAVARLQGIGHQSLVVRTGPTWEATELGREGVDILLAANLGHLRALAIESPSDAGARALAASSLLRGLERFSAIDVGDVGPLLDALDPERITGLSISAAHPAVTRFHRVRDFALMNANGEELFVPPNLEWFAYDAGEITSEEVERVATCPDLVQLRELQITDNSYGELTLSGGPWWDPSGWRQLAKARFADLRVLRINANAIAYREACELLQWPIAEHLEVLELDHATDADRADLERRFGGLVELRRYPWNTPKLYR